MPICFSLLVRLDLFAVSKINFVTGQTEYFTQDSTVIDNHGMK